MNMGYPFFYLGLLSYFSTMFCSFQCMSLILYKFISRYFTLLDSIINGIVFLCLFQDFFSLCLLIFCWKLDFENYVSLPEVRVSPLSRICCCCLLLFLLYLVTSLNSLWKLLCSFSCMATEDSVIFAYSSVKYGTMIYLHAWNQNISQSFERGLWALGGRGVAHVDHSARRFASLP